jgi:hypothetical protein
MKIKVLEKHKILESDWSNMSIIDLKLSIQTVQCNFISIENTISHLANPEISEAIDMANQKIITYLEELLNEAIVKKNI